MSTLAPGKMNHAKSSIRFMYETRYDSSERNDGFLVLAVSACYRFSNVRVAIRVGGTGNW